MRRLSMTLTVLLPLVAIALSVLALYFAYIDRRATRQTTANGDIATVETAEAILERANDAVLSADLILSFLEGASVLAGILLIGAGVLGVTSLQDLRQDTEDIKSELLDRLAQAERELNERVDVAQKELLSKAEQLAALEAELEATIARNREVINEQIQAATKEARRSFEALSHHIMAQRLARENNVDAAITACREAYELDPDNVPNNYLLGTLLTKKNDLDDAIRYLTLAFEASQEEDLSIPAQAALGLALRKKGDLQADPFERNQFYHQAEGYLIEATQHDPQLLSEDRESYFGILGSLYRRQERTRDAIAAFQRAAEITPRRSYPYINLAMLYLEQQDQPSMEAMRRAAEQRARRRLEDTPDDYWARHDVALAVYLRGDVEEALRLFDEAIELSPGASVLDSVLARLLYLHDIAAETPGIDRAIERFTDAINRFNAGKSPQPALPR